MPGSKRWYYNDAQRFRSYHRQNIAELTTLRAENAALKAALSIIGEESDIPLWKRIAHQRFALKRLERERAAQEERWALVPRNQQLDISLSRIKALREKS